jgi:hypothetical protein
MGKEQYLYGDAPVLNYDNVGRYLINLLFGGGTSVCENISQNVAQPVFVSPNT